MVSPTTDIARRQLLFLFQGWLALRGSWLARRLKELRTLEHILYTRLTLTTITQTSKNWCCCIHMNPGDLRATASLKTNQQLEPNHQAPAHVLSERQHRDSFSREPIAQTPPGSCSAPPHCLLVLYDFVFVYRSTVSAEGLKENNPNTNLTFQIPYRLFPSEVLCPTVMGMSVFICVASVPST